MDRYNMFRKMLDFVNTDFEITDADIKTYDRRIVVEGVCPLGTIRVEVTPREAAKEAAQDA